MEEKIKYQERLIEVNQKDIFTYRLALKALVGDLPEYVAEQIIHIAGKINSAQNTIDFANSVIESIKAEGK